MYSPACAQACSPLAKAQKLHDPTVLVTPCMLALSVPSCVHLSVATPQAYSPLAKAQKLQDPTVGSIAQRLGVTPA